MNLIVKYKILVLGILSVLWYSCGEDKPKEQKQPEKSAPVMAQAPVFNEDSAFVFIEKQLSFGPRVPNSSAHEKCAQWLKEKFDSYGAKTSTQTFKALRHDGKNLNGSNIIASWGTDKKQRILLSAHWDSRHVADESEQSTKAVPAANDGASGVAVLLEIARNLQAQQPALGIDIILWDAEDQGVEQEESSWCLGSRHWAANLHVPGYKATMGINLDMVGGVNTWFPQEQSSIYFAGGIVNTIWETANAIGYGEYFPFHSQGPVLDDHLYVNRIAGIPMVDIIARDINGKGFFEHWHTEADDIQHISKPVLKAVGQTVSQVIYNQK
jgi:Zn-dependent M28 family amino/carboxypeptidase